MLSIILVSPQLAENIGMVARVMLNFNITNLIIINPKDENFYDVANTTSCLALKQLNISIIKNQDTNIALKEAVKPFHNIFALTARTRDLSKSFFYINDLKTNFQFNQNNAFLFGSERTGLTNNELSFANFIISINSNPNFSSLNLAQAVGLCCYEYSNLQKESLLKSTKSSNKYKIEKATQQENQSFLDDLFNRLEKSGFFNDKSKKEQNQHNIKDIFLKASLTSKEINILRGMIKYLSL